MPVEAAANVVGDILPDVSKSDDDQYDDNNRPERNYDDNEQDNNSDTAWQMARLQTWCTIQNGIIMSQRSQPHC